MRIIFQLKNNLKILAIFMFLYFYDKGEIQLKSGMPSKLVKAGPVIKIVAGNEIMMCWAS